MLHRRIITLLLITGLFVLVCGCASPRQRVMKDYASPHVKGGLADVSVHAHGHGHGHVDRDCFDIFLSVILFLWIVELLAH
ncbi:MAG: hypothetical protein ACYS8W_11675 [Planctomycetota bacterium]